MKTKEVIKLLQDADPSGELECFGCGNSDITYVDCLPAYYDGSGQLIIRDEKGRVIGAKFLRSGNKVCIRTMDIEDALWDNPDLPVDFSEIQEWHNYRENVEKIRKEVKEYIERFEKGNSNA